jgi:hypothetical protein
MGKALLISVVFANVALPVACAGARDARRGLLRALLLTSIFEALYMVAVLFIYPRL